LFIPIFQRTLIFIHALSQATVPCTNRNRQTRRRRRFMLIQVYQDCHQKFQLHQRTKKHPNQEFPINLIIMLLYESNKYSVKTKTHTSFIVTASITHKRCHPWFVQCDPHLYLQYKSRIQMCQIKLILN